MLHHLHASRDIYMYMVYMSLMHQTSQCSSFLEVFIMFIFLVDHTTALLWDLAIPKEASIPSVIWYFVLKTPVPFFHIKVIYVCKLMLSIILKHVASCISIIIYLSVLKKVRSGNWSWALQTKYSLSSIEQLIFNKKKVINVT